MKSKMESVAKSAKSEGLLLRPATLDDAMAVARVHVRSWQVAYLGLLPDSYLDNLKLEERAQRYTFGSADPSQPATWVAVVDGTIRGFATTAPARDADASGYGELCGLYVDPEYWNHGIGMVLLTAAQERLKDQGFKQAVLWVLVGNERAQGFYRKSGWLPDGAHRTEKIGGVTVDEVRYRRQLT